MARSARCDVRWRAAVFVESDETILALSQLHHGRRLVGFSCRSAARTSRARIARWRPPTSSSLGDEKHVLSFLLSTSARAIRFDCSARQARCVQWLAPLAAMFVGEPPSSSYPTKRSCAQPAPPRTPSRRLLLQIGGANVAGADRALDAAYFVVARGREACPLVPPQHVGARDPL